MTPEEFLLENQGKASKTLNEKTTTVIQGTCDPCEMARLANRNPREIIGSSSDSLDPETCIMVDEFGRAQYMHITEDGRWVPIEQWFGGVA